MISATQRILCSLMVVLFLLNSCAPAPAATSAPPATENPAVARLQQTVDALLATQSNLITPTPDSPLPTLTAEAQTTETPNFLQQTVEAISSTQVAEQAAQQNVELQQTVDAIFATQNALSTLQQELQGPTPTPQPALALDGPTPNPTCGSASQDSDPDSAPEIITLSPDRGETYGGKSVTVKGKNLISADGEKAAFCFGDFTATNVICTNTELCTMDTPGNPKAGVLNVRAVRDELASQAKEFTYLNPPTVDLVEPNSGPLSGGTRVNIEGSGFSDDTVFFFGSGNQARTESCNGNLCTVISPGLNSDQDLVVWVQAVERGAYSELDTGPSTQQTFKFVAPAKYACDAYLVYPGQGPFRPQEPFEIQWVVKNTGTNAWPAGQDVRFSAGSNGNMATVAVVQIKRSVRPNDTETVTIQAKAPNKKGLHYMTWVVSGMGCSLYIAVRVE